MIILAYISLILLSAYSSIIGYMTGAEWRSIPLSGRLISIGLIISMMLGVFSIGFLIP